MNTHNSSINRKYLKLRIIEDDDNNKTIGGPDYSILESVLTISSN